MSGKCGEWIDFGNYKAGAYDSNEENDQKRPSFGITPLIHID